ncbi:MAG: hypothetical protein ACTTK5_06060 [Candidatus Fimenecus sp.]
MLNFDPNISARYISANEKAPIIEDLSILKLKRRSKIPIEITINAIHKITFIIENVLHNGFFSIKFERKNSAMENIASTTM